MPEQLVLEKKRRTRLRGDQGQQETQHNRQCVRQQGFVGDHMVVGNEYLNVGYEIDGEHEQGQGDKPGFMDELSAISPDRPHAWRIVFPNSTPARVDRIARARQPQTRNGEHRPQFAVVQIAGRHDVGKRHRRNHEHHDGVQPLGEHQIADLHDPREENHDEARGERRQTYSAQNRCERLCQSTQHKLGEQQTEGPE